MEGKVCQNSKCAYSLCLFFMVKMNKRVKGRNLETGAGHGHCQKHESKDLYTLPL